MEEDNWDLQAVVRSCSKATTTFSGDPLCSSSSSPLFHPQPNLLSSHPPLGDLQEICRPFFHGPSPLRVDLRPSSHLGQPLQQHQQLKQRPPSNTPSRLKRRKNQVKKVVSHVPADGVCSDVWAWRKYGQKPIKGSPFPRGYYRCSSSKGCPARKLVERSRTDPTTFIVTYTSEHNHGVPSHRSCLAGSTRSSGKTSGGPPPPEAEAPPKKDSSTSSNASDAVITVDEEVLMIGTFHGEEDDDDDGVCCSNSGGVIEFGSLGC